MVCSCLMTRAVAAIAHVMYTDRATRPIMSMPAAGKRLESDGGMIKLDTLIIDV